LILVIETFMLFYIYTYLNNIQTFRNSSSKSTISTSALKTIVGRLYVYLEKISNQYIEKKRKKKHDFTLSTNVYI
jgi:hypothetical protein